MDILGLLSKLDWVAVISAAVSFIVGLAFIKPKLGKAVDLLGDISKLLSDLKGALADGSVTKEESQEIIDDIQHLIAEFKK